MKLKLHALAALAAIAISLFGAPTNAAAQVIEDQIGTNYEHLFPHMGTRAFYEGSDSYSLPATRTIASSGGILGTVSWVAIGVDDPATRNMTQEEWGRMRFMIRFFSTTSRFLSDPAADANWVHTFTAPTNSSWLTPIGSFNGFDRYRLDFDLSFMNEQIGVGQDFAIAIAGITGDSVVLRTAFSTGGGFGPEIDLAGFDTGSSRNQDYLNNMGAPSNWHATSITLVPEPGTCVAVGVGVAYLFRRKRRSRG